MSQVRLQTSFRRRTISSVIIFVWLSICLVSIIVRETIATHNYEHDGDRPPLVSPEVYAHQQEEVHAEVENHNGDHDHEPEIHLGNDKGETVHRPPFVSPEIYAHHSSEEMDIHNDQPPPVAPEVHPNHNEQGEAHHDNVPLVVAPVVVSKNTADGETEVEIEASEDKEKPQKLNAENMANDPELIKERLHIPDVDTSKMTREELQFHYFKIHDIDQNNYLDGCELMKIAIHWHDTNHQKMRQHYEYTAKAAGREIPSGGFPENKIWSDRDLANFVDPILLRHDINRNGLIDYTEYKSTLY